MMTARRCVILDRATELDELLAEHGTLQQARFVLRSREIDFAEIERRHAQASEVLAKVAAAVPHGWNTVNLRREDLDRFLFRDSDLVIALGQDGLVANLARYLDGQPVIGVNNAPELISGVLATHSPADVGDVLSDAAAGRLSTRARTMVEAAVDDGQRCIGLNEVYFGHSGHQSAKYELSFGDRLEYQSSSGLVVATGTGGTGWAASLNTERGNPLALPGPFERRLAWFVREPWPSRFTGSELVYGMLDDQSLRVTCRLGAGAVIFSDGIETDALSISYGQHVEFGVAKRALCVVE